MEDMNTNIETGTEETTVTETESKTFTEEEVLALIQSESDKRVQQALKTQAKKHQKELSLSKLDAEEREKAEKDNRIAELEEKLAAFEIEKNRVELMQTLSARGLSTEFANLIAITDDIEESQERIDKLDSLFKKAVKAEVEKRLAGTAPVGGAAKTTGEVTKEQFSSMPLSEQAAIYKNNPELYKQLTTI